MHGYLRFCRTINAIIYFTFQQPPRWQPWSAIYFEYCNWMDAKICDL